MVCNQSQTLGLFDCVVGPTGGSPCVEAAQEGTPVGTLAGAIVGSLLFIVILIIIVVLVKRECKCQKYSQNPLNI